MIHKIFITVYCIGVLLAPAQEKVTVVAKDAIAIDALSLFGIDAFETIYYSDKQHSFYKKTADTIISYANFQLGKITSANAFNPLKINIFYQDFNTVIILDNRLAEISKIDFNTLANYKNVSFVSTGFDNTLWLFNQDIQQLELYNYVTNTTRFRTVPIQSKILDLKSDYNYCYLLTESHLYIYNYFGSLIQKIANTGFTKMAFSKAHLVLKNDDALVLLSKKSKDVSLIDGVNFLTSQFLVTNESLYLYQNKMLYRYQFKQL